MDQLSDLTLKVLNLVEAEGRYVKRHVYLMALSLILISVAGIMLMVAALAGIAALFVALQNAVGTPWALAVSSFFFAVVALAVGGVGLWLAWEEKQPIQEPVKDGAAPERQDVKAVQEAVAAVSDLAKQGKTLIAEHPWSAAMAVFGLGFLISSSAAVRKFFTSVLAEVVRGLVRDQPGKPS